jgi:hypothetical protein
MWVHVNLTGFSVWDKGDASEYILWCGAEVWNVTLASVND